MSRPTPKLLANWLYASSEQLGAMLSHVRLLRRLTAFLRDRLPPSLAAQCHAAKVEGTTLVIAETSSAWAAKLRYQHAALSALLKGRSDLPLIEHIRIRVQPLRQEPVPRPLHRSPMSADTAALICFVVFFFFVPALREF